MRPFLFWEEVVTMNKKDTDEHLCLQRLMAKEDKIRLKRSILEIKEPVLETEKVLNAESASIILEIIRYVQNCKTIFVTPDHPDFAPRMPAGIKALPMMPSETTYLRERPYFLDADGYLREIDCDVRQERKNGVIKQTTKVGKGGTSHDSTMDRMEQASRILSFGFNVYAIGDRAVQRDILDNVRSLIKPGLRMVSQRVRIPYHPEGNPHLLIELALEHLHFGETFTGFVWERPKIDLEIKRGPKKKALRHAILAREEERLLSLFPLTRQLQSSPTPGFEEIADSMHRPSIRARFERMGVSEEWWNDEEFNSAANKQVLVAA